MNPNVVAAIIGGVCGLITGALGSLVAPWIHWGIEKTRERRNTQQKLLSTAISYANSTPFSVSEFSTTPTYLRLKPYLKEILIEAIEKPDEVMCEMYCPEDFTDTTRRVLLENLARLEKEWKLI